ncbi:MULTISPECIES: SDR family NAD(P)-dependent oxidoreductase [Paraburkholderia]|uniref:NAD(P)-dependent dehydrogenase, short-chain alcohol dehydrogenase family n=1 Tax=Paraburkholderia tuberum TaxID=157910 RepID=A0A1H1K426_9BURK|nr:MULTISPECIES: SDR family oxidoreductase [Paraburkholderia]MBB5463917.1 NAD(P)-dependent dehydrogenase (short-subunit alcohol dehydrogenase family) [Paraburkholderia sp. CI2]MBC8728968.1 SDR family oxidoreductase [Paraburkholderia sp. UCT2]MBC8739311.1 SDR family oxidoreductase [Paraburkholderia sp. UCT31]MDH6153168.1 NAD(P)-dependent dehydrogenase (short-subunit alcohol dehydrogenase family) [Paraburkholderia sp. WSM4179]SDR56707.1 NAD(P)-dependent dehydrogenase, short-chain alcohol dehydro
MTFQNQLLEGKTALVTGGLSGIGAAIANTLAQLGAHTVAAGLPLPEGTPDTLNREIARVTLDVRSGNAVTAAVNAFERLDIVVNCAGVISRVEEHRLDVFERVMDINLNGTMRVCAAARDSLKASAGCIVNTASMLSFFGGGLVPAYSASKGAVAQLTKSLAIAYAADGIRVNAVAPGWIATPLTQALQDDDGRSLAILERTPLRRWGTPEEVAQVAVFLCSPAASFMTGAIVPVDGGYLVA